MPSLHLSVVIPAYNEATRLPETLAAINEYLAARPYAWEVIVADDGSEDDTAEIVRSSGRPTPDLSCTHSPSRQGRRC